VSIVINPTIHISMTKINILKTERLLIDRDNIVMDTQNEICRGQFGPVFKGIYHSTEFDRSEHVAVKCKTLYELT